MGNAITAGLPHYTGFIKSFEQSRGAGSMDIRHAGRVSSNEPHYNRQEPILELANTDLSHLFHNRSSSMRKARHRQDRDFGELKLYRDTIEEIGVIIAEHSERISIKAGGYELDDLSDLEQMKEAFVDEFDITGWHKEGYVSLGVSSKRTNVSVSNINDIPLFGTYKQIERVLESKGRRSRISRTVVGCMISGAGLLLFLCSLVLTRRLSRAVILSMECTGVVAWLSGWILTYPGWRGKGGVYLQKPEVSFWRQRRYDIFLLAIGAVLTLLVQFVISELGGQPKP
jgi:hypothetical protein